VVAKIEYVQKEIKIALEVLKYPPNKIFYLSPRLDECEIPYTELRPIRHVDLFPVWNEGVEKILQAIGVASAAGEKQ
jgi:hypothetical protein